MQKIACPHCGKEIVLVVKKKPSQKAEKKEDKDMTLDQFQIWCEASKNRHIRLIGSWARVATPKCDKMSQWNVYIKSNVKCAITLSKFSDEQIQAAFSKVEEDHANGLKYDAALSTLLKKLTK